MIATLIHSPGGCEVPALLVQNVKISSACGLGSPALSWVFTSAKAAEYSALVRGGGPEVTYREGSAIANGVRLRNCIPDHAARNSPGLGAALVMTPGSSSATLL